MESKILFFCHISHFPSYSTDNLTKYINLECIIDRELKSIEIGDIKTKLIIKSYQGIRHLQGLPVNGQNTKNNSKTAKSLLRKNLNDNK